MGKQRKARRGFDRPLSKIDGENRSRSHMNLGWIAGRPSKQKPPRDESGPDEPRDLAFRRVIFSIPTGKVSTYGGVAAAAGYPRLHRAVARLLSTDTLDQLPWHRVLGAGGEIKLSGAAAREQRARLKLEGVKFIGKRADMERFEHLFSPRGFVPD
jgi:methylated-DNA-protein-cysteine methyltransferase-like protein